MENENIITEELEVNADTELDTYVGDSEDGAIGKIVIGAVVATAAAIGFAGWKFRDKIDTFRIKRLEKKGYVVNKIADDQIHEGEYRDCTEDEDEES